jgi:FkbM family methyltransferase
MTIAEAVAARGVRLELHPPGDFVSDEIRQTGDFFEAEILEELTRRIDGGVLIDAGAMVGNHTAFLAEFVRHAAIHAFEPWPDNLALLFRNVAAYPTVTVHAQALSDRPRTLRMQSEANRGHSMVVDDGPLEVQALPLDEFAFDDVTLLKIDVESHEPQVLIGAAATIARCHPLILIEDWTGRYGSLLPGYRLAAEWGQTRQTYLYEWAR